MPSEKELLERIKQLEDQNSALQDKLDMIWAVIAPDYDEPLEEEADGQNGLGFVQIEGFGNRKKLD